MLSFFRKKQIEDLYLSVLDRPADPGGLQSYLESHATVEQIEQSMRASEEYIRLVASRINYSDCLIPSPRDLPKSGIFKFWDLDSQENFNKAKQKFGDAWTWSNRDIDYSINSLGYRMKDVDQIDWDNYMAVLGCSITAGIGLPLEETFAYRISQSLGLDLVNAGLPGGSNNLIVANLTRLLASKNPPKLVIINWTGISRKFYWNNGKPELYQVSLMNNMWRKSYENHIENSAQWCFEFLELKQQVDTLCKLANIPCWQFTNFTGYDFTDSIDKIIYNEPETVAHENDITYLNQYAARDFNIDKKHHHPGINLQDRIVATWNEKRIYK